MSDSVALSVLAHKPSTHIIVTSTGAISPDMVSQVAHKELLRGSNVVDLKPLTSIQSAQRLVYFLMSRYHLCPMNEEQKIFKEVAELVRGSPYVVDLVCHSIDTLCKQNGGGVMEGLRVFDHEVVEVTCEEIGLLSPSNELEWCVGVFISKLLPSFSIPVITFFLLCCLSLVRSTPFHISLLLALEDLLTNLVPESFVNWQHHLLHNSLLCPYPRPVVQLAQIHRFQGRELSMADRYFYIPDVVSSTVYSLMDSTDKVMACGVMHSVLSKLMMRVDFRESHRLHFQGLQHHLLTAVQEDLPAYSEGVFQAVFQQYILAKVGKDVETSD